MSNVIKFGRIQYIEPNEIFGGDNQPVNQEDLSKYVNLSVKIPSRYYQENNWVKSYDTILRGESFENVGEYTKFYLTDNYVNVSYTEFKKNGEISVGELFGIDSIDISFDVQFFPQVTINFTDVKGFGLMSTMEYNYSEGKINDITAKSFFTSLFNFPYPIFTLEVKGYYGKSVSFDLSLSDFHTAFDSTTGNFKTTVKFIGHMYGVYTDIPMSYLMVSPYLFCNVALTGNTIVNGDSYSNAWTSISNGYPTYLEFINSFNKILTGDFTTSRNIEKHRNKQEIYIKLLEAKEIINEIIEINKQSRTDHKASIFYFTEPNESGVERLTNDPLPKNFHLSYDNTMLSTSTTYYSKSFFHTKLDSTITFKNNSEIIYSASINEEDLNSIFFSDKTKEEILTNYTSIKELNIKLKDLGLNPLITSYINADGVLLISGETYNLRTIRGKPLFKFKNLYDIKNEVDNEIIITENDITASSNELNQTLRNILNETIGFDPCIENYYKLMFKHLNCFTKNFYNIIDEVNIKIGRYERNLETILRGYETDIKYVKDSIQQVPQFPLVMDSNTNIVYPGEIITFQNEPEIKLVDEIYSSMLYFGSNSKNIYNNIANNRSTIEEGNIIYDGLLFNDLIPSVFTDENNNHVKIVKNYAVLNDRSYRLDTTEKVVDTVKKIFLSRLCLYNKIHAPKNANWSSSYTNDSVSVANIESELLKINCGELCDLYPDFYEKLSAITTNDVLNTFKRFDEKSFGIINYKPGMEEVNDPNTLYKYDIHVNDTDSSVLVLEEGSFEKCSLYLNKIGFTNRKNEENTMTSAIDIADSSIVDKFSMFKNAMGENNSTNNVGVGGYSNSSNVYINGITCDNYRPTTLDLEYNRNIYTQSNIEMSPIAIQLGQPINHTLHIIYTPFIFVNKDVLDWVLDSGKYYSYNGVQISKEECVGGLSISEYMKKNEINSGGRITGNKISIVRLDQLKALGEFFEQEPNGCILGYAGGDGDSRYKGDITDKNVLKYTNNFYAGFNLNGQSYPFQNFCKNVGNEKSKYYRGSFNEKEHYLVIAKNYQYKNDNNNTGGMTDQYISSYWFDFVSKVGEKYNIRRTKSIVEQYTIRKEKEKEILNLKTNIYYTLKNLYDKWFCSLNRNIFDLSNNNNESTKIKYLNAAMEDISNKMVFNYETCILHIEEMLKGSTSVMEFMTQTAEKNKSTFLTLPIDIFDNTTEDGLRNIFKPFSFYNQTTSHDSHGVSYIFIHNGDVSHNLNINESEYIDDGYDMVKYSSSGLEESEVAQKIFNDHDSVVNAFGVTYGMQNQNFFKNISVDTSNPTITDYSIANTLVLAEGGNNATGLNNMVFKEKSLYPIYANRSYNCTVEMLGCMYITPLMYFQLNNIPMFRGTYIITNVNHKITPNDFTTIFTGVRVSKYKIPINVEAVSLSLLGFGRVDENDENGSNNSNSDNEPISSIGSGEAVNINTDNDTVNLNIKDGVDCKCFFKYKFNCDKKKNNPNCNTPGNEECCDCHRSAVLSVKCLLEKHGINDDGSYASKTNSIRLTYEKNKALYYFCLEGEDYKNKYGAVVNSIINHLDNKKPVIVGVNHTFNKGINEGTSDHWVTIYAYGYSGTTLYFRYFESGSNSASSSNRDDIFLYEDGDKPKLYNNRAHPSGGVGAPRRYDVTVVKLWHDTNTLGYTLQDYSNGTSVSSIPIL